MNVLAHAERAQRHTISCKLSYNFNYQLSSAGRAGPTLRQACNIVANTATGGNVTVSLHGQLLCAGMPVKCPVECVITLRGLHDADALHEAQTNISVFYRSHTSARLIGKPETISDVTREGNAYHGTYRLNSVLPLLRPDTVKSWASVSCSGIDDVTGNSEGPAQNRIQYSQDTQV